jgi:nondiscriminating aspartyl-tRNA synthetase
MCGAERGVADHWAARLVSAANVRETTLFPRDLNRLTP